MTAEIINGREIANTIKKNVSEDIKQLRKDHGIVPRIATVIAGENPESLMYMRLRKKACDAVGIESIHKVLPEDIPEDDFLQVIQEINTDDSIHGLLIQLPLEKQISFSKVFQVVDPLKDVEGLTPFNMGQMLIGKEFLVPCTPLAVLRILDHINLDVKGKHVVIVNHSLVVGKPLTALCLNRNATVSVCHVFTDALEPFTKHADVVISAAGVPGLITKDHVRDESCIIDVSIVKTDQGICGDVKFDEVSEKVQWITPVPGGVGPVTVACSLENMVKTVKNSLLVSAYE